MYGIKKEIFINKIRYRYSVILSKIGGEKFFGYF
jgi:hypothetical protein